MFGLIKQHKWKSLLLLTLITLLLLLPYLLKITAKQVILDYTKPYGIQQVTLEQVNLNLFKGSISVHQLNLYKNPLNTQKETKEGIVHIGELSANIEWLSLLKKRILIQSLYFSDTNLPFSLEGKQLFLANIPLTSNAPKEPAKNQSMVLLPGLDNIKLHNIQLSLTHQSKTTSFAIKDLNLNHLYAWSNGYGRLQFKAYLNKSLIQTNLQLHLFADEPKIIGTLKTTQLNASEFKQFLPKLDFDFQALLDTDITFTLTQTDKGPTLFQQGNITLNQVNFTQKETQANLQTLNWKGDFYYSEQPTKTIELDGNLTLQEFNAQKATQQMAIAQTAISGKTTLSLAKNMTIESSENVSISGLTLNDSANKQNLSTDLSAKLNANILIEGDKVSVNQQGSLSLTNLTGSQEALRAQLEKFNWQGDLNLIADQNVALNSRGKLQLNQFKLSNRQTKTTIAQSETAKIENLTINNLSSIVLKDIAFNNFSIANHNKQPGLVTLQNLTLNQAEYLKQAEDMFIDLGKLSINGSETHLSINKEGKVTEINHLLSALPLQQPSTKEQATKELNTDSKKPKSAKSNTFNYQLASLNILGKNLIYVVNEQVNPPIRKTLQLEQFSAGKIASKQPQKLTDYSLKVVFDEFSHLTSQGSLSPLEPTKNLSATTKLDSLSLVEFSPLVEGKVGYQIASGQVSAELETRIKDNQIDTKNKLHLNKFELTNVDNEKSAQLEKGFPIPLKTGLAMLKDKNDNIELSLPVQGDLNNPDFNINDIISTALGSAIAGASRTYLLLALQPFGAIALAGEYALDKASAITLQAIDFQPGFAGLNPSMQSYLKKITKLLGERKAIQIKVCGGATEADRIALKQTAIKTAIENQANKKQEKQSDNQQNSAKFTVPEITISNAQMLKLADERQKAIKRYLIKMGAASNQVVICKPEIIKGSSKAQVKLTI